jgi:hypothetical protein
MLLVVGMKGFETFLGETRVDSLTLRYWGPKFKKTSLFIYTLPPSDALAQPGS